MHTAGWLMLCYQIAGVQSPIGNVVLLLLRRFIVWLGTGGFLFAPTPWRLPWGPSRSGRLGSCTASVTPSDRSARHAWAVWRRAQALHGWRRGVAAGAGPALCGAAGRRVLRRRRLGGRSVDLREQPQQNASGAACSLFDAPSPLYHGVAVLLRSPTQSAWAPCPLLVRG